MRLNLKKNKKSITNESKIEVENHMKNKIGDLQLAKIVLTVGGKPQAEMNMYDRTLNWKNVLNSVETWLLKQSVVDFSSEKITFDMELVLRNSLQVN